MKKSEEIIDTAKQEAKEKLTKMVDEYFANNTNAIENKKYTIDMIEDFLVEAKADAEEIMREAAEEIAKASEAELVEKKNCVQDAEKDSAKTEIAK